jgi:hypothetical protein
MKCVINMDVVATLALGSWPRQGAYEGANQKWSPKVKFYVTRSVKECEEMNLHTPKWALILGVGVPMDPQNFKEQLQGSKPIKLKSFLYH